MNQATIIINLFGAPGTGKSTTAAGLVYHLKSAGIEALLIGERYKFWAMHKTRPSRSSTFVTIGEQVYDEAIYYGVGNVLVCESPLEQNAFYYDYGMIAGKHHIPFGKYAPMTNIINDMRNQEAHRIRQLNYLLSPGAIKYDENGRFESEDEASLMAKNLERYLDYFDIHFTHILPDTLHLHHRVVRDVFGVIARS